MRGKENPKDVDDLTIASSNPPAGKDVGPESMVIQSHFPLSLDVTSFSHRGLVEALGSYWRRLQ